jgi:ATP-binding cassette, subfamily C, bacterial
MQVLLVFARAYPRHSCVMLVCLLFAAVAEGVGFSTILPLLSLATQASMGGHGLVIQGKTGLGRLVDHTLAGIGLHPNLGLLCVIIVLGMVLKAGFVLLAQKQIGYTVAHIATDLRLALLRGVLAARWEYYIRQPIGSLANAFTSEASRAAESYLYATSIVALSIQTLLYTLLALAISWQGTLGAVLVGVLLVYVFSYLVRMTRKAGARQTNILKALLSQLTDVLYAVKPFKAMAREPLVSQLLEGETQRLNRAFQRDIFSKETLRALQDPLVIIVLTGGLYVALTRWALPLDVILAMALLFERTLSSVNKMQRQYQSLVSCESAFWSLRATITQSEAVREVIHTGTPPRVAQGISFDQVSLSYDTRPVLRDVSLCIPAGQVTAIIGPSGAGKTSLVDLLVGLVTPQSGTIWLDDVSISDVDLKSWRWTVGYVPQEMLLVHATVAANVTMGDPTLTATEIEAALRAADAWGFVSALPDGVHTPVGERGARFSGGERQRIAIARALIHKPQLLILDEATAALDPESEAAICATVNQLRGRMTILVISHRPALLETADCIYYLEQGTVRQVRPTRPVGGEIETSRPVV